MAHVISLHLKPTRRRPGCIAHADAYVERAIILEGMRCLVARLWANLVDAVVVKIKLEAERS